MCPDPYLIDVGLDLINHVIPCEDVQDVGKAHVPGQGFDYRNSGQGINYL